MSSVFPGLGLNIFYAYSFFLLLGSIIWAQGGAKTQALSNSWSEGGDKSRRLEVAILFRQLAGLLDFLIPPHSTRHIFLTAAVKVYERSWSRAGKKTTGQLDAARAAQRGLTFFFGTI